MFICLLRCCAFVTLFATLSSNAFAESNICSNRDSCYDDCCTSLGGCSAIPHTTGASNSLYCSNNCGFVGMIACTAGLYCKFNTNASEYNFLELTNRTNRTIYGQLSYLNNSGVAIGNTTYFQLSPYQRKDVDIHSIVGQNKYGQVLIKVGSTTTVAEVGASVSHYYTSNGKLRQTVSELCESALLP